MNSIVTCVTCGEQMETGGGGALYDPYDGWMHRGPCPKDRKPCPDCQRVECICKAAKEERNGD